MCYSYHRSSIDEGDRMKKKLLFFLCLFLCLPFCVYAKKDSVIFSKCIDGDTAKFKLKGEEITVRFLAVDTPEVNHPTKGEEPYGKEASNYTCEVLKNAKKIKLEYDDASDPTDKYDRYLAWIWVNDELLQENLIKKGLAKVAYLYGNYKYVDLLKTDEEVAQAKQIGIWSDDHSSEIESNENNKGDIYINIIDDINIDYNVLVISLIIIIILCIFFPKYRKKTVRKTRNKIKKTLTSELEKNLKKI